MIPRKHDIVTLGEDVNLLKVLGTDPVGVYLEDDKGKRKYVNHKDFAENYLIKDRNALDSNGIEIKENVLVKDRAGFVSKVTSLGKQGSVYTEDNFYEHSEELTIVEYKNNLGAFTSLGIGSQVLVNGQYCKITDVKEDRLGKDTFYDIEVDGVTQTLSLEEVAAQNIFGDIDSYKSLAEGVLYHEGFAEGSTKVYFLEDDAILRSYLKSNEPTNKNLRKNYKMIGMVAETDLTQIQKMFKFWSLRGEAKEYMEGHGIHRTKLNAGDLVQIGADFYMYGNYGFSSVDLKEDYNYVTHLPDESLSVGDPVRYGTRDKAKNMKWMGTGKISKIVDNGYIVKNEIGKEEFYLPSDIEHLSTNKGDRV